MVEAETKRHTVDLEAPPHDHQEEGVLVRWSLYSLIDLHGFGFLSTGCCHCHGRFM